jgi:predicted small metal-binding protein
MYELRCRDVGFDCAGVVRGTTREVVLQQAAAHAAQVHQFEVTTELATKVSALIREIPGESGSGGTALPGS